MDDIKTPPKGEVQSSPFLMDPNTYLDQCTKTTPVSRPMGMGKLGDPTLVFVRKFRWTLEGKDLDEGIVKSIKFDFKAKTISFKAMEVAESGKDINIHAWLENDLSKEKLIFTTYDGCGTPLYTQTFSYFELLSDSADFDYASSEESYRNIVLKYRHCDRARHGIKKPEPYRKKRFDWELSIDKNEAFKVKVNNRPNLKVEETEINFLNGKMWIPGKASWESISVEVEKDYLKNISSVINGTFKSVDLTLKDMTGVALETWTLNDFTLNSLQYDKDTEKFYVTLKYVGAMYKSHHEDK